MAWGRLVQVQFSVKFSALQVGNPPQTNLFSQIDYSVPC